MSSTTADLWAAGDYQKIAEQIEPGADALLDEVDALVGSLIGKRVLDVAAGTGNATVVALARGASVLATDITPRLVDAGRRRTLAHGDRVEWRVADAVDLPVDDDSIDVLLSTFGMIFVPDTATLVAELARVLPPGGLLAFTSWKHTDGPHPFAEPFLRRFPPGEDDDISSMDDWGVEERVHERLEPTFDDVRISQRSLDFVFDSAEHAADTLLTASPMHVAGLSAIPADEHGDVRAEFVAGLRPYEGEDGFRWVDHYFVVTARRA